MKKMLGKDIYMTKLFAVKIKLQPTREHGFSFNIQNALIHFPKLGITFGYYRNQKR